MIENKVIAACLQSPDAFERVRGHLVPEDMTPQARAWWPLIVQWYRTERLPVDLDQLKDRGRRSLPEKHLDTLIGYLDTLPGNISPQNVAQDVLEMKRFTKGNELCAAIQSNDKKLDELLEEYQGLRNATQLGTSEVRRTVDLAEMRSRLDRKNLIRIAPRTLNLRAGGGAARGDHIVLFGRPESGKTLMTVNMVSWFLRDGHKVLYLGNEEDTFKTLQRIQSNLCQATRTELEEEPERYEAMAYERGLDKLEMYHINPGTIPEIEELLEQHRPDVLVLDQIRNIHCSGDSLTRKLETLGIQVRALLGKYDCVGVSVTQAGDRTERYGQETPIWLQAGDLDSSRTGLPAQADLLLGVGVSAELDAKGQRAISLCKNKLNDAPDAKHGFLVQVDIMRSTVR